MKQAIHFLSNVPGYLWFSSVLGCSLVYGLLRLLDVARAAAGA
jgi:hypothetical protein